MSSNNLFPICFIDPPKILNATVTNIPGAGDAPLEVIADSGIKSAQAIDYIDSTGNFIGVYTGGLGQETLRCIIGGGIVTRAAVVIAVHSRVSLRSMTADPITNGKLTMVLMGFGLGNPQ